MADKNIGILFPGQGAQYVGMGKALYEGSSVGKEILDKANDVLGGGFLDILFNGPTEKLTATDISQPAIYAASYAAFKVFTEKFNGTISAVAGLSLGEYSALTAAGSLPFDEGIKLVQMRGKLMQEAAENNPGAMASVLGLEAEKIDTICIGIDGAYVANYNSPGQIVISGTSDAVAKASAECSEAGARRVIPLKVSGAFHTQLMESARKGLQPLLESVNWKEPAYTVLSNVTGMPYSCAAEMPELLGRQVVGSVRWEDNCRWMLFQGIENYYEVGPGKVLQGLMKKIERAANVTSVETPEEIELVIGNQ